MDWWQVQDNVRQVVQWGDELITAYPGSRIFALGQSLAWIVKAAELKTSLTPISANSFGYIPFSRRFTERRFHDPDAGFISTPSLNPTAVSAYRKQLSQLGLSPAFISHHYNEYGRPTVITDYAITGRGVASFLHFMLDWAQETGNTEAIRAALFLHLYTSPSEAIKSISLNNSKPISCQNTVWKFDPLTEALINSSGDDRLLPDYPYTMWADGFQLAETAGNKQTLQEIIAALYQVIAPANVSEDWKRTAKDAVGAHMRALNNFRPTLVAKQPLAAYAS